MAINSFPIETTTVDVSSFQETLDNFTQYGSGVVFQSREEAESTSVASISVKIGVVHDGAILEYISDAEGTALTTGDGRTWSPADIATLRHWGAVADGVDTGSAFEGTDCTPELQSALDWCSLNRKTLVFSAGVYYLRAAAESETVVVTPTWVHMTSNGDATLLLDEDTSILRKNLRSKFGTPTLDNNGARDLYEFFRVEKIHHKMLWDNVPIPEDNTLGENIYVLSGYKRFEAESVTAEGCRAKFFSCGAIGSGYVVRSTFERMVSDVCRFVNTPNFNIESNEFRHTADDSVALHSRDAAVDVSPSRAELRVANNVFEDCEAVQILGPHTITVTGNILRRCVGSGLNVAISSVPEGSTSQAAVIVSGNIVEDGLYPYTVGVGFPSIQNQLSMATIGGGRRAADDQGDIPGEYLTASQSIYDPKGEASDTGVADDAGPFWNNNFLTGYSNAASFITFSNNQILRTLPSVDAYSDWGFGEMFNRLGWQDPAVSDTSFRQTLLAINSDIDGFAVSGNIFRGASSGYGVFLFSESAALDTNLTFRNGLISENMFLDCYRGISHSRQTSSTHALIDISVKRNIFDIDPHHKQPLRSAPLDGSWQSTGGTDAPVGIVVGGYKGWRIEDNEYKNCFAAYLPFPTGNVLELAQFKNELLVCEPSALNYSAANRGIGYVLRGDSFKHMIVDSDPTSPTWREILNICPTQGGAQPSAGTWVQSHIVWRQNPTASGGKVLMGWIRLTTGSDNVAGTDWEPLYATTT